MTATVRLNNQHDYITLSVIWSCESRLNVTWNRSGVKLSATSDIIKDERTERVLFKRLHGPKNVKIGAWAEAVRGAADGARDLADLCERVARLHRNDVEVRAVA